ncbi:hypothetical protein BB559_000309 [Furculomyces boomerangus]|uniref:Tyrosinase copper-binding domain-containing protein n=2 Tax=Harpellales TaxID=61421 RepID=A0A2T9Z5Q6_9FUNG|nr:hypothetical protein BB559_000309 [Furculomyces boomerangus]PWA03385.1 hypothetical protein BB558_000428 [Smittium angustum]
MELEDSFYRYDSSEESDLSDFEGHGIDSKRRSALETFENKEKFVVKMKKDTIQEIEELWLFDCFPSDNEIDNSKWEFCGVVYNLASRKGGYSRDTESTTMTKMYRNPEIPKVVFILVGEIRVESQFTWTQTIFNLFGPKRVRVFSADIPLEIGESKFGHGQFKPLYGLWGGILSYCAVRGIDIVPGGYSIAVLSALVLAQDEYTKKCTSNAVRKEIRSLSQSDWTLVSNTVTKMHNLGWFMWFAFVHQKLMKQVHFVPVFLPWHRRFTREFESIGQYYNPNFAIPYWDSTIDFANPASSVVLSKAYLGGNGGSDGCVQSGLQFGWNMTFPLGRCLTRSYLNNTILPWQSPESVTSTIQTSKNFDDFRNQIEYGIHASIHSGLGGDMAAAFSPNDFAFFVHHSNMDRIYWKWQNASSNNTMAYSNSVSESLPVFGGVVSDVLVVGQGSMCYSYDEGQALSTRGISTDSTDISNVLANPDMSLATGIQKSTIEKYFPSLNDDVTVHASVALPNVVSQTAAKYAQDSKNVVSGNTVGSSAPVYGSSISGSLVTTANTIKPGRTRVMGPSSQSSKPQIPAPFRLPDDYIHMMNYDLDSYNKYYADQVELVNALNSDGYVSPYI